jgi:putative ABC transport system permease protein
VRLIVAGIALGLAGAFGTTHFMSSQLLGVSRRDPVIFATVTVLLAGVAVAACLFPARRAASVDPMHALRHN